MLINNTESKFDADFCHDIIQYRKKFLLDNNLPSKTIGKVIPSSHLPINYLQNHNDIFLKIKTNIFDSIKNHYALINTSNLNIDSVFFVENSYENNPYYIDIEKIDYTYGFLIILNEKSYYKGGEIFLNSEEINIQHNNRCILFTCRDELKIRDIYCGEQMKLLGFINHNLINNSNEILEKKCKNMIPISNLIIQNKMKSNINTINNLLRDEECDRILNNMSYEIIKTLNLNNLIITDTESVIEYSIDTEQFVIYLIDINNNLINNKTLLNILNKYSLLKYNITSYIIKKYKKNIPITYYSPLIKDTHNLYKDKHGKMTLLVCLNEVEGSINFEDYNEIIYFKKGDGILIPNNFLYRFYIELKNKEAIFLETTFF